MQGEGIVIFNSIEIYDPFREIKRGAAQNYSTISSFHLSPSSSFPSFFLPYLYHYDSRTSINSSIPIV